MLQHNTGEDEEYDWVETRVMSSGARVGKTFQGLCLLGKRWLGMF